MGRGVVTYSASSARGIRLYPGLSKGTLLVEAVTVYPRAFYFDFALAARSALMLRRAGPQTGLPASAGSISNLGSASNALRNSSRHDFSRPETQVMKPRYLCALA